MLCPFRTKTVKNSCSPGGKHKIEEETQEFEPCIGNECPAYSLEERYLPNTGGMIETVAICKRCQ